MRTIEKETSVWYLAKEQHLRAACTSCAGVGRLYSDEGIVVMGIQYSNVTSRACLICEGSGLRYGARK